MGKTQKNSGSVVITIASRLLTATRIRNPKKLKGNNFINYYNICTEWSWEYVNKTQNNAAKKHVASHCICLQCVPQHHTVENKCKTFLRQSRLMCNLRVLVCLCTVFCIMFPVDLLHSTERRIVRLGIAPFRPTLKLQQKAQSWIHQFKQYYAWFRR